MVNLFANAIKLRQAEPPEGRAMYPLGQSSGGGDGLDFVAGTEIFQFSSEQIPGPQRPSSILGMWVDATNLTAGKNLTIKTAWQTFVIAGGNQAYIPITVQKGPFSLTVSSGGGQGVVIVILYNYNPLFTGAPGIAGAGGGAGGSGGSSGGQAPAGNQGQSGRLQYTL
jgi:hypothetical protein